MRAVALKCPQCGAALTAGADATHATCSYCGTVSQIQGRTFFQLPRHISVTRGMPVVRPAVRWGPALVLPVALAGVGITATVLATRHQEAQSAAVARSVTARVEALGSTSAAGARLTARWYTHQPPLVTDLDGDGGDDLVGILRQYEGDEDRVHLVAVHGSRGEPLWISPSLGTWVEANSGELSRAGALLLRATDGGELRAFDAGSGAARWTRALGEKVQYLCAGATSDHVIAATSDRKFHRIELADGARSDALPLRLDEWERFGHKAPKAAAACTRLPSGLTRDPAGPMARPRPERIPGLEGLYPRWRGQHPTGVEVVFATKTPGSPVPVLLARQGNTERWRVELSTRDPLRATSSEQGIGFAAQHVVARYAVQREQRLALFDAADGARRWDVEVTDTDSEVAVVATAQHVLLVTADQIAAHALADGARAWSFGYVADPGEQGRVRIAEQPPSR